MANEQNLKRLSPNEARENGKKGGIKSGEARRARKTLKEELLLSLSENNEQNKLCVALLKQAQKGNVKAFETIRDTVGEKPTDKQEITNSNISTPTIYITETELKNCNNVEGIIKKLRAASRSNIKFVTKEEIAEMDAHIDMVINEGNYNKE